MAFPVIRAGLPLVSAVLEFCWIFPWVLLMTGVFYGRTPTPLLPAPIAFALLLSGFLAVRAALARSWTLAGARAAVVAAGFAAGMAAVKATYYPGYAVTDLSWIGVLLRAAHDALPIVLPPVTGALVATLLWWRGVVLGERDFSHFEVETTFRRGVGWTVLFVFFYALYGDTRGFVLARPAPIYLLIFFSLSLTAMAVARLIAIWQDTYADEDQALATNRHWLLLLVGVVGLIFSAASAVSGLVEVDFRPSLLALVRPLEPVAEYVFYAIFVVALLVARVIIFIFSRLPFRSRGVQGPAAPPPSLADLFKDVPPHVISGARWGMVMLVVALLVLLVAVAVVRARRRARKPGEDERESVWSTQAMWSGMAQAWRSLWSRRRTPPPRVEEPSVGAIRMIYRNLLRLGASLGVPRSPHQTPHEHLPRLAQRLEGSGLDLAALTEAYSKVRYGSHVPSGGEVEDASAEFERIRLRASGPAATSGREG